MDSESPSSRRRRIASFTVLFVFTFMLLIVGIYTDHELMEIISPDTSEVKSLMKINEKFPSTATHRKLLNHQAKNPEDGEGELKQTDKEKMKRVEPNRIWSDKCSKSDIVISQGATEPLPNGIPTYTVEIMNVCVSGCDISAIHLSCGWFSSARLVNPRIFKRVHFDDCLVNDGKPLVNGRTLSFQYANTFRYPLSVSSVTC